MEKKSGTKKKIEKTSEYQQKTSGKNVCWPWSAGLGKICYMIRININSEAHR